MVELYEHNKRTYQNLTELFKTHDRVACVQPTGTGKSFIMLKLIEDNPDKKFLVTSPSIYIFEQIKTHAMESGVDISNCEFCTYQKIIYISEADVESIEADYILLDEFHRLGSPEWGERGINYLLETHKTGKVFGASATPVRFLDNMRNMGQEIFDDCYAVNMSLSEAIRKKILPLPTYITAWYSFANDIAKIEARFNKTQNGYLKEILSKKIQKAKSKIADVDCGLEKILQKRIENRNGKYIIFCADSEGIENAQTDCKSWFRYVNENIHIYSVYSYGDNVREQFDKFRDDESDDALKILLCIDMLNEGVHIKGVDGVIMLRSTRSGNVFYQQLGRALSCSKSKPVIFDLVNNYETGDTAKEYADIMELGRTYCADERETDIAFEIYDYARDIRTLLDDIYSTFDNGWENSYDLLCEFIKEYGRFPCGRERYKNYTLGDWCIYQRMLYKKNRLSPDKVKKFDELNFVWDRSEDAWNVKYEILKDFLKKNGRLVERKDICDNEEMKMIYTWLSTQRGIYSKGLMSEEHIQKLEALGFELTFAADDELWEQRYCALRTFYAEHDRFPSIDDTEKKTKTLYSWMVSQRALRKNNKLSEERIQNLDKINFIWNTDEYAWNKKFEILRDFIKETGRVPKTNERYGNCHIGQWYNKQRISMNNGVLCKERQEKLESLELLYTSYYDEKWLRKFELLKKFIKEKNRMPYSDDMYSDVNLYAWINKQKQKLKNGKLDERYTEKFRSIGIDLFNFSSNKPDTQPSQAWVDFYTEYKDFVLENNRKPGKSESGGRLYRWRRRQIQAIENNKLNETQYRMLEEIHFS